MFIQKWLNSIKSKPFILEVGQIKLEDRKLDTQNLPQIIT